MPGFETEGQASDYSNLPRGFCLPVGLDWLPQASQNFPLQSACLSHLRKSLSRLLDHSLPVCTCACGESIPQISCFSSVLSSGQAIFPSATCRPNQVPEASIGSFGHRAGPPSPSPLSLSSATCQHSDQPPAGLQLP